MSFLHLSGDKQVYCVMFHQTVMRPWATSLSQPRLFGDPEFLQQLAIKEISCYNNGGVNFVLTVSNRIK